MEIPPATFEVGSLFRKMGEKDTKRSRYYMVVSMLTEITELYDIKVYSDRGILIGSVKDVILDTDEQSIYGLYIENTNQELVEGGSAISIPFRWIKAVGEIILLKKFPQVVKVPQTKDHI